MGKDTFEFVRMASSDEVADYLASLAQGLKRGEVSLESGDRVLRLIPPAEVKFEVKVKDKERKGKVVIEIGWKRRATTRATDLTVQTPKAKRAGHS